MSKVPFENGGDAELMESNDRYPIDYNIVLVIRDANRSVFSRIFSILACGQREDATVSPAFAYLRSRTASRQPVPTRLSTYGRLRIQSRAGKAERKGATSTTRKREIRRGDEKARVEQADQGESMVDCLVEQSWRHQ